MPEALASSQNGSSFGLTEMSIARRLQRWTAVGSLALVAATWRLWTPQTAFPQVPAFQVLCQSPAWMDWICLAGLLTGLVFLAIGRSKQVDASGNILVLSSLLVFFCLDQHRFQPWAYQLWLYSAIWISCGVRLRLNLLKWLTVSIYFYSALGKLDFEFLHSVGFQMLRVLFRLVGQDVGTIPLSMQLAMVATFPCVELAVAIGLTRRKSRRMAGFFAIGLHLILIVVLGPIGLGHRLGVLIWNALFAVQAYYLFVVPSVALPHQSDVRQSDAPNLSSWRNRSMELVCRVMIAVVVFMPLTERFGLWDHWPSWALYAPHSSRVQVDVAAGSISRLPRELVALLLEKPNDEAYGDLDWVSVPIDAWSLQTLDAPIYPQARFQLGVARHIANEVDADFQVRVTILGSADRFTGHRQRKTLDTAFEIAEASIADYWLNSKPRVQPSIAPMRRSGVLTNR
jgi:hypothetical protein